jgi:hypothetical protein
MRAHAEKDLPAIRGEFKTSFRSGWGEHQHHWGVPLDSDGKVSPNAIKNSGLYGLPDSKMFRQVSTSMQRAASVDPEETIRDTPLNPKSRSSWPGVPTSSRPASRSVEPQVSDSRPWNGVQALSHADLKRENSRLKRENQSLMDTISNHQRSPIRTPSRSTASSSARGDLLAENDQLRSENETLFVTLDEHDGRPADRLNSSWALSSHNKPACYLHHLNRGFLLGTGILVAKTKTPQLPAATTSAASLTPPPAGDAGLSFSVGQQRTDGWGDARGSWAGDTGGPRPRIRPYLHLGRLSALNG